MSVDTKISQAWMIAAAELGIRVVAPATINILDGRQRRAAQIEAHVLDFGSREGALAMSSKSKLNRRLLLDRWSSILDNSYRAYNRKRFVETLNDWGWFGSGTPPAWYNGLWDMPR